MKQLNSEHQTILDQKSAFGHLRVAFEDDCSNGMLPCFDSFSAMVSHLMLSELHARQMDRCRALRVYPQWEQHCAELGREHNHKALSLLAHSQASLWKFKHQASSTEAAKSGPDAGLDDFRHAMRESLCLLPIKVGALLEIDVVLDEVCIALRDCADQTQALDFIDSRVKSLETLRKIPGRNTDSHLAGWQLLVIEIVIAMAAWANGNNSRRPGGSARCELAAQGAVLTVATLVLVC